MDCSPPGSSVSGDSPGKILEWIAIADSKKDIQLESCELSFIWGKMRTSALEATSQIALRDCSQRGSGGKSIYEVLLKGEFNIMNHSIYKRFFVSHEDLMSP